MSVTVPRPRRRPQGDAGTPFCHFTPTTGVYRSRTSSNPRANFLVDPLPPRSRTGRVALGLSGLSRGGAPRAAVGASVARRRNELPTME